MFRYAACTTPSAGTRVPITMPLHPCRLYCVPAVSSRCDGHGVSALCAALEAATIVVSHAAAAIQQLAGTGGAPTPSRRVVDHVSVVVRATPMLGLDMLDTAATADEGAGMGTVHTIGPLSGP